MANKTLYVVTLTDVGLVSQSVDTFVLGYLEDIDDVKNFLKNKYDSLCKLGYDTSRFERTKIGLIYKSDYRIYKYEIHVATNIDVHEELAPQSELVSTPPIEQNILYDYNNNKKRKIMATKKVYPFIQAKRWDKDLVDDVNVVFDAREVESYSLYPRKDDDIEEDDVVFVCFKSGKEMTLYQTLNSFLYPDENLITAIDKVQNSHFWHDNEDSMP